MPDATTFRCPEAEDGFRWVSLGRLDGLVATSRRISASGDGHRVVLALSSDDTATSRLVELDGSGAAIDEWPAPGLWGLSVAVDDGHVSAVGIDGSSGPVVLATGGALHTLSPVRPGSAPEPFSLPPVPARWNGTGTVVAVSDGSVGSVGSWSAAGFEPWWRGDASRSLRDMSVDAAGFAHVVHGDEVLTIDVLSLTGAMLTSTALSPGPRAIRLRTGLFGYPAVRVWVVVRIAGDGMGHAQGDVRLYQPDGAEIAARFVPVPDDASVIGFGLATSPLGSEPSYAVVVGHREPPGARFHGGALDDAGDVLEVPAPCDGQDVAVAAGPCGYVVACTSPAGVELTLAVPPWPW